VRNATYRPWAHNSRNLLFKRGTTLDEVYENLLDRTRRALDVKTLKTIFGRKYRPHNHTKRGSVCRLEKVIERPAYNLTVFKLHFGKLTLKIYDKGDRVLRVEVVAHNVKDLRCGALVEKWPRLLETLEQYLNNFLNIVQAAHVSFLDEGTFDSLAAPTQRGNRRQAGVDFNKVRMRRVAAAVVALAPQPTGFTVSDLARKMSEIAGPELQASLQLLARGLRFVKDPWQRSGGTYRQVSPLLHHVRRRRKVGGLYHSSRSSHQASDGRRRSPTRAAAQDHSSCRSALSEPA